jgi:hypothetical protein
VQAGVSVPAFEGPEFQPNVISLKIVGEKGSGIDVFEKQQRLGQVVWP